MDFNFVILDDNKCETSSQHQTSFIFKVLTGVFPPEEIQDFPE